VHRLALFGSFVRDQARSESDVDVLVEFVPEAETADNFFALCDLLEGLLERDVDLVTTNSLSPFIGPHILAQAIDVIRAA
jgi:predicted nucleotidyltransferase